VRTSRRLTAPNGAEATGLGGYGLGNSADGSESRRLGQGSLSRLLETDAGHMHSTQEEPDTAQPLIFAAIAVIIGILIL